MGRGGWGGGVILFVYFFIYFCLSFLFLPLLDAIY